MFESGVKFFSSGSTLLDLALGGGWPLGRIFNIVGDKSTGKTLLAIEAFANYNNQVKSKMRYAEAEAAFDESFAEQLGFPDSVERPEELLNTVEDFQKDFSKFIDSCQEEEVPGLYILDSLDALSDSAELKKFEEALNPKKENEQQAGSYGTGKAKEMSKLFRMLTKRASEANCALGVVSQIRDNIGVMFGETKTRSGGRALDFYASQVLWLAEVGKKDRMAYNQKRVVGVSIHSKVKKCKVGLPFREADYDILFGYGIDDESSLLSYLYKNKQMAKEAYEEISKQLAKAREAQDYKTLAEIRDNLKLDATRVWREVEEKLTPKIRKYNTLSETAVAGDGKV
jgi:recombination protein RecA